MQVCVVSGRPDTVFTSDAIRVVVSGKVNSNHPYRRLMMENEKKERRSFLKHILAGSTVLAVSGTAIKPARAGTSKTVDDSNEVLYQESDAFKKYYKSLRS